MRIVAVFDTNVVFSGIGWKGTPHRCLELARLGQIEGVVCPELLEELSDKLRTKLELTAEFAVETIADLLTFLRVVVIDGRVKGVALDPDDDVVLECAAVAGASYIVTGDRRHLLPLGNFQGIRIVTPVEFLAVLQSPG